MNATHIIQGAIVNGGNIILQTVEKVIEIVLMSGNVYLIDFVL